MEQEQGICVSAVRPTHEQTDFTLEMEFRVNEIEFPNENSSGIYPKLYAENDNFLLLPKIYTFHSRWISIDYEMD